MILADLPYAHESAAGAEKVSFFPVCNEKELARQMGLIIQGNLSNFVPIIPVSPESPFAGDWERLFAILLEDESITAR